VEECLQGSEQAWSALLDRYKDLVFSIPLRYGAPQQDAADIFQAVWLDLFNELPRLRDAESLQSWLIRVTSHKCYHWKRGLAAEEITAAEPADIPASGVLASDVLAELEREQVLREAVAELPPRCRQMISLLFYEQPPSAYAEVARRLHIAAGSVGFIRGRCLKRLKAILVKKGF
jgi:RNA polymerase sigma factor (sigma-70 family)